METNHVESTSKLRIITYNIYAFRDQHYSNNANGLADFVNKFDPDIVGLNEVLYPTSNWTRLIVNIDHHFKNSTELSNLIEMDANAVKKLTPTPEALLAVKSVRHFAASSYPGSESMLSNGLIINTRKGSKLEDLEVEFHNRMLEGDYETRTAAQAKFVHPSIGPMEVFALHLDHINEPTRLAQLNILRQYLPKDVPHFLMGDFNALCKSDYSPEYESEIRSIRQKGKWESPHYDLIDQILDMGYVDVWRRLNPKVLDRYTATCAYDTRIDYIFASPSMADKIDWDHEETSSRILREIRLSDHAPVICDLVFK